MSWEAWRPRRPQRMALVGVLGTAIMVPVFLVDVARNSGDLRSPLVAIPLVLLMALAAVAWKRGLHVRPVDRSVTVFFYGWSAVAAVVLVSVIAAAGGDPRRFGLIFGTAVATQAAVYPLRGQLVLLPLNAIAYTGLLVVRSVEAVDIVLQLGMFAVLAMLVSSIAGDLHDTYEDEAEARQLAETRARLAGAISRVTAIEPATVHDAIVQGSLELGFSAAYLGLCSAGGLEVVAAATDGRQRDVGFDLNQSIAGVALAEGRTVSTPDQQVTSVATTRGAAIAVPIRDVDRTVGVLYAAMAEPGELAGSVVETIEVFAAQAGRALSVARLYTQEHETVVRLTELDAMKGDFITNVSHELRTPLTVIRGLGETMEERWSAIEGATALSLLARINANSRRLETMIRGLLDFSKFQAGEAEIQPVAVNVAEMGERVLDRMAPLIEGRPLEVSLDDVVVEVDPSMLEHVLENLVGNALRYTPEGTPLAVLGQAGPGGVRVTVADDGPGVPTEDLERLTDRFYRGGDSNSRPAGGLGLGLSLCQQILEAHGSKLEIVSPEGEGARFSFWLRVAPLVASAPRIHAAAIATDPAPA